MRSGPWPSHYDLNKLTYLLTYLLTPWCRDLLEQLTGLQLVKEFPAFHGTRRFITALTSVRHLSLSWASQIQSTYPRPTSWWSVIITLCTCSFNIRQFSVLPLQCIRMLCTDLRQTMHIYRNTEGRSCKHCCSGKTVLLIGSVCL